MFTVINGVLLKPLAYPGQADRLVALHGRRKSMVSSGAFPILTFWIAKGEPHSGPSRMDFTEEAR